MACCSDGVITNRWANFKRSFCSSAMNLAISPCAAGPAGTVLGVFGSPDRKPPVFGLANS